MLDGLAFFVGDEWYQSHIKVAKEMKEKNTCNQHWAVKDRELSRQNLDSTRISASVCARHRCWVPHSIVDFQKGERQVVSVSYHDGLQAEAIDVQANAYGL